MSEINYQKKYLKYKRLYLESQRRGGQSQGPDHDVKLDSSTPISYFFDNDPDNFLDQNLCPEVKPVLIKDSQPIQYGEDGELEIYVTPATYDQYCHTLNRNAQHYCLTMKNLDEAYGYDPDSGITSQQIEQFKQKVELGKPPIKSFIFDWDRTLTVFEGVYAIKPTVKEMLALDSVSLSYIKVSDVASYYFGGETRVHQLQQLWKTLTDHGVEIWVLSSNPAIGEYPQFFLDLLDSINLPVDKSRLIYRDALTKYQYIKQHIQKNN